MWTGPRQIFENSPEIADKYRRNDEACLLFTCSPPAPYKCQNQKQRWSLFMALFLGQILFYFFWTIFRICLALFTSSPPALHTNARIRSSIEHFLWHFFSCIKFCFLFFVEPFRELFNTVYLLSAGPPTNARIRSSGFFTWPSLPATESV